MTPRFSLTASVLGTSRPAGAGGADVLSHVPPVWPPEAGAEQIGGHEDDDEIVRVYREPAGHPFCLFTRTPVP